MRKIIIVLTFITLASISYADTFTVTVSTTVGTRIKNAFGTAYGYQPLLADGSANPQSLAQFTLQQIKNYIKNVTVSQETIAAATAAQQSQSAQSNVDIVIP